MQGARRSLPPLTAQKVETSSRIMGGVGSAVAEVVVGEKPVPMKLVGVPDVYSTLGPADELWARYGLNSSSLIGTVKDFLKKIK